MFKTFLLWVIGLLTMVPLSLYYLFFSAGRDDYAFLITFILFWIFGFWGIAGPIIVLLKLRNVLRKLETSRNEKDLENIIKDPKTQEIVIDQIASENKIPKFLARLFFKIIFRRLTTKNGLNS